MRRRAVVFILSDFMIVENPKEEESQMEIFLQQIATTRRKHDVICARIHDPIEKIIPEVGLVEFEDLESGEYLTIDTNCRDFQEKYSNTYRKEEKELKHNLRRRGIDIFDFSTNADYANALQEFFQMRENKRR